MLDMNARVLQHKNTTTNAIRTAVVCRSFESLAFLAAVTTTSLSFVAFVNSLEFAATKS